MRYYIGFLVAIGLIGVLLVLLFHGGKSSVPHVTMPLYNYANTGAEVRFTFDGPINADQIHQQVQITVNQNVVTYDQFQGYDGNVVNQTQFNNSVNAFSAFLHAINLAGFTLGNTSSSVSSEEGHCALGDRYIFEVIQGGKDAERFWATSCPKVIKSYEGNLPLTITLFEAQIPGYGRLTQGLTLSLPQNSSL